MCIFSCIKICLKLKKIYKWISLLVNKKCGIFIDTYILSVPAEIKLPSFTTGPKEAE